MCCILVLLLSLYTRVHLWKFLYTVGFILILYNVDYDCQLLPSLRFFQLIFRTHFFPTIRDACSPPPPHPYFHFNIIKLISVEH